MGNSREDTESDAELYGATSTDRDKQIFSSFSHRWNHDGHDETQAK